MVRARILAALALAAGFAFTGLAFSPAQAATIIKDGNFNDPLVGGTFATVAGGSFFGTGNVWQVTGNSVDVIGNYWQAPPTGGGSVDLAGNGPGGISQSFTTGAGAYQLSFYLAGNPDGAPATKTVEVSVGGVTQDFTFDLGANTRGSMGYDLETLLFLSNGSPMTLSFLDQDKSGSPFGPVIGGVSISAVPEAATWMMMILGFGGIGMMLRASRRREHLAA